MQPLLLALLFSSLFSLCNLFLESSIDVADPFQTLHLLNAKLLAERCLRCTKFSPDVARDVDANERFAVVTAAEQTAVGTVPELLLLKLLS